MKSTGIVRKINELGYIVLPIEPRRTLDIEVIDSLEIIVVAQLERLYVFSIQSY